MKKFLFACLFFALLSASASAATINAPAELPGNLNWSFSVDLDSSEAFSETRVLFDEKNLLSAYSNGIVSIDAYNGQFVLKAFVIDTDPNSNAGLKLFVSMIGLEKGDHKIAANVLAGSESKAFVEKPIVAFAPLSENYSSTVKSSLDNISLQVESVKASIEEVKNSQKSVGDSSNAALKDSEEKIRVLQALVEELQKQQEKQQAQLEQIETSKQKSGIQIPFLSQSATQAQGNSGNGIAPPTSFFSLSNAPLFGLVVLVIIVAVLAFFFLRNRREEISLDDLKQNIENNGKDLRSFQAPEEKELPKIPLGKLIRRRDD